MYAPNVPLWAVTYHAFQTSSHGKYRLMAKKQGDEKEVADILVNMQQMDNKEEKKREKREIKDMRKADNESKKNEKMDKVFDKVLKDIRTKGDKQQRDQEEKQLKETKAFEDAINREEKKNDIADQKKVKSVLTDVITKVVKDKKADDIFDKALKTIREEEEKKEEKKEEKQKKKDALFNKALTSVEKKIVAKEEKEQKVKEEKERSNEERMQKTVKESSEGKLITSQLFSFNGPVTYSNDYAQTTNDGIVERLLMLKDHPQVAVVKRVEKLGSATRKSFRGYRIVKQRIERASSIQDVPLIQDIGISDAYMMSNPPPDAPVNRMNMKQYTYARWKEQKLLPATIQMKSLIALNNRNDFGDGDILIAHQPGEGKTVNAILMAEMKRNNYIRNNQDEYNQMIRKWEFCRIVITAPKSQILLQWQNTICKWGFDPLHYVFQTEDHFYRSQTFTEYPAWTDLTEHTKDLYQEIWEDMKQPKDLTLMNEKLAEYKRRAEIKIENKKTPEKVSNLHKKTYYVRNMMTGGWVSLKAKPYNSRESRFLITSKRGQILVNKDEDLYKNFLAGEEGFMCVTKEIDGEKILLVFHGPLAKVSHKYIVQEVGKRGLQLRLQNNKDKTCKASEEELKSCDTTAEMMKIMEKYAAEGGLKTVDQFITNSHGKNLVQHRYKVEPKTILIIDECHEALSALERIMVAKETYDEEDRDVEVRDFQKRTKAYFKYGKHTIANILVSATPMLSRSPFKQLRIIAKFLNRETDYYGIGHSKGVVKDGVFKPYPLENGCMTVGSDSYNNKFNEADVARKYVKYSEVISSLRGKITRSQYILNEDEFQEEMDKQGIDVYKTVKPNVNDCKVISKQEKYLSDVKYVRYAVEGNKYKKMDEVTLGEHIMQQYLYGNKPFFREWSQSADTGLVQSDRYKILRAALRTLYITRSSAFENPFPVKYAINDGYTKFERDIVRKYLTEHRGSTNVLKRRIVPDMMTISTARHEATYIFHKQLSEELQDNYKHVKGFYPVVVTILDSDLENKEYDQSAACSTLKKLQEMAFSISDKWVVILNIPGGLKSMEASAYVETALKQVHVGRYDSQRSTKGAIKIEKSPYKPMDIMSPEMTTYLEKPRGEGPIGWLRLREGTDESNDRADKVISIPGILSSRIEKIVLRIEECVANNKNVLVYNNNIEVLKAIEFGLKARNNRRIYLQDIYNRSSDDCDVKQWITSQKEKIYHKWNQWDKQHREGEIHHLEMKLRIDEEEEQDMIEEIEKYDKDWINYNSGKRKTEPQPTPRMNRYKLKKILQEHMGDLRAAVDTVSSDSNKFEYLAKYNESKRPTTMYKLKKKGYRSVEGYWETEEGTFREHDAPWGYMPQTKRQYIAFKLNEYTDSKKKDTIAAKITQSITKSILQGEVVSTEIQLIKAYMFYFNNIQQFEKTDLSALIQIGSTILRGNIRKNIRGIEQEKMVLEDIETIEKAYSNVPTPMQAAKDFLQLATHYYQTRLREAMIDKKSTGGRNWWSDRLREKVKKVFKERPFPDVDKKKMKKLLKSKTGVYYKIKTSEKIPPTVLKEFKEFAVMIDKDMEVPNEMTDAQLIEHSKYLFDIFNTEKIQEIKHALGMQKFPVGGASYASYMYLSPMNKKLLFDDLYDLLNTDKKFKKNKDGPDNNTINKMISMTEEMSDPKYDKVIKIFHEKYKRLKRLSTFNTYQFTTPDHLVKQLKELQADISLTNHTISINKWEYLDTSTFEAEYYETKKAFLDEEKVPEPPTPSKRFKQNNVPGRMKKSYQWGKNKNPYLRPHPLNSTVSRDVASDITKSPEIDRNNIKFSCLRQNTNDATYETVMKRVMSQKKNKVSFSFLTGKHTRKDDDRELYKMAFECGMIDCLLMNKACITGIDFDSLRESECIIATCEKLPGVQDQFVGRLVRRFSHAHCPKEFQRVSYHAFEEKISDDKRYEVEPYHLLPSPAEGGLFDMSKPVRDQVQAPRPQRSARIVMRSLQLHEHDSDYEYSSEESDDDSDLGDLESKEDLDDVLRQGTDIKKGEKDQIFRDVILMLGWSNLTNKKMITELKNKLTQLYEAMLINNQNRVNVEELKSELYNFFVSKRNRFKVLQKSPVGARFDMSRPLFDHVAKITRESLWRRRQVYYNITCVPVYNNHAFYSPFDLLESGLSYEYGPRLWSEKKQHDEVEVKIDFNWSCYVCNYDSPNKDVCEKCGATNLDKYYKMEPFYLDNNLELTKHNRRVDERYKKIFEHNRMVLNQTNLDLSMQSIEHVGKMKKDMIVDINHDDEIRYIQRIQNKTSHANYSGDMSAIDIVYGESAAGNVVSMNTNYESDTPSIQSEYDD